MSRIKILRSPPAADEPREPRQAAAGDPVAVRADTHATAGAASSERPVIDSDARRRIAQALSDGTNAPRYEGTQNKQGRWGPIEVLAADDDPFFIAMGAEVLGVDFDGPGCADAAEELFHELTLAGLRPVLCNSGGVASDGQPRRHVWAWCRDRAERERWDDKAEKLGGDVRRGSRKLRPPGIRHRDGLNRSVPVLPAAGEDVVARLCEPRPAKPLKDRHLDLIRSGAAPEDDRSRVLQSVVSALHHRGVTADEVLAILTFRKYGISVTYRAVRADRSLDGDEYFRQYLWPYAESTSQVRNGEIDRKLRRFRAHAWDVVLAGEGTKHRPTDLAVLEALIQIGERAGKATVDAALRDLSLTANIASLDTVRNALDRLEAGGLVSRVRDEDEVPAEGGRWVRHTTSSRRASRYTLNIAAVPEHLSEAEPRTWLLSECFRDRTGCGKLAGLGYQTLADRGPQTLEEITARLRISARVARAALRAMERYRLVSQRGRVWEVGPQAPAPGLIPAAHQAAQRDMARIEEERGVVLGRDPIVPADRETQTPPA